MRGSVQRRLSSGNVFQRLAQYSSAASGLHVFGQGQRCASLRQILLKFRAFRTTVVVVATASDQQKDDDCGHDQDSGNSSFPDFDLADSCSLTLISSVGPIGRWPICKIFRRSTLPTGPVVDSVAISCSL